MSAAENFVSRWARLKRESDSERKSEPDTERPQREAVVAPGAGAASGSAQHENDAAMDEPFDPASLPPIETITIDTDIRAFLRSRVPAELTRAALRQAWASDPAIRDFIGIAENQWDFNDPNAIIGFGPLQAADNAPALLQQALGGNDKLAETFPEMPVSAEQAPPSMTGRETAGLDRSTQQTSDMLPPVDADVQSSPVVGSAEGDAIEGDRAVEGSDTRRSRRSHGGALPR